MRITRTGPTGVVAVASFFLSLFFMGSQPVFGSQPVAATSQGADAKMTRVDVGFDMGGPGANVSLAIELTAPDGVAVGTTVNAITFPTKLLSFEEARIAPGLEADVKAVVKPDTEHADHAIVEITVVARPGTSLSNGLLASAAFKIAEGAQASGALKLENVARALSTAAPPSPIDPVTGKDGEIELIGAGTGTGSIPAVIPCFFYMH